MTNHWVDIKNANVVMVMGGNAAEAHPVGFRWAMEAKNNNDATLIVVDPRFTRTASVADIYAPIRSGTDITFLSGVLRYLIENNKINAEYVRHYTNASLLVRDDFAFEEGLFSGYDTEKRQYDIAQKAFETAKSLPGGDTFPLIHRGLGGIYMRKGMNKQAVGELEKYLQLAPKARHADSIRQTITELKTKPEKLNVFS